MRSTLFFIGFLCVVLFSLNSFNTEYSLNLNSSCSLESSGVNDVQFPENLDTARDALHFILFYESWCSHSRHTRAEFSRLSRWISETYQAPDCLTTLTASDIRLIAVNITRDSLGQISKVKPDDEYRNISAFFLREALTVPHSPLLRLYIYDSPHAYTGGLTAPAMASWLIKKLKSPSCYLSTPLAAQVFLDERRTDAVALLSLGTQVDSLQHQEDILNHFQRAGRLTEDVAFGHGPWEALSEPATRCGKNTTGQQTRLWVIPSSPEESCTEFRVQRLQNPDGYKFLMEFLTLHRLPPIVDIASYHRLEVFKIDLPKVVLVYDKDEADSDQLVAHVYSIVKRYRPRIIFGTSGTRSTVELRFLRILSLFSFSSGPVVAVVFNNGTYYNFRHLLSDADGSRLTAFLESVLEHKNATRDVISEVECLTYADLREQYTRTGNIPVGIPSLPVQSTSAKRFAADVLAHGKPAFVLFYFSLAKQDQQIFESFLVAARRIPRSQNVTLLTFNTAENEIAVAAAYVTTIPSLAFFDPTATPHQWKVYKGPYNSVSMHDFVMSSYPMGSRKEFSLGESSTV